MPITSSPRGCEPKAGGDGWKGVAEASPCSGKLVALFSSHCYKEAGEAEEGRMFGFAGLRPLSASLQPRLHFPEGGVSCPGPPPTTEPQRIQTPHRLQGSGFTQLTMGDLIWEGQPRKDTTAQSKQRDRPQQKRPLQRVLIITELWRRPTPPPWRPRRPRPSGALADQPEQHRVGPLWTGAARPRPQACLQGSPGTAGRVLTAAVSRMEFVDSQTRRPLGELID